MMPRVTFWASLTVRSRRERITADVVAAEARAILGAAPRQAEAFVAGRSAGGGMELGRLGSTAAEMLVYSRR